MRTVTHFQGVQAVQFLHSAPTTAKPEPERLLSLPEVERLLSLPEVEQQTGLKKTKIYGLIRLGEFPPPIRLTRRASRWPASQVQGWIADRIAGSI